MLSSETDYVTPIYALFYKKCQISKSKKCHKFLIMTCIDEDCSQKVMFYTKKKNNYNSKSIEKMLVLTFDWHGA